MRGAPPYLGFSFLATAPFMLCLWGILVALPSVGFSLPRVGVACVRCAAARAGDPLAGPLLRGLRQAGYWFTSVMEWLRCLLNMKWSVHKHFGFFVSKEILARSGLGSESHKKFPVRIGKTNTYILVNKYTWYCMYYYQCYSFYNRISSLCCWCETVQY